MDDLRVPPCPGAPRGLTIPGTDLVERFSRSSGPGGQGVNTADSRVQLSVDLRTTSALDESQRARVLAALAPRLADGVLMVGASEHRAQRRNRVAARARLAELLLDALTPPVRRHATRPTRGSQRRRLVAKRQRSEVKRGRGRLRPD